MFESLTITTILFILFFFWQNKRLGLTSEVPLDPNNRVHYFASECLTTLKNLLPRCHVRQIGPSELSFAGPESELVQKLYVKDGQLWLKKGEARESAINELGPQGEVHFEKTSETGLIVTVEAKTAEAAHKLSVRLEVSYA
ncbi:MAG: hypothetical protein KF760_25745 [Candidatus Eremiobacteraeota bacterium]|nr:hypothetical protein [Candidatus Eremiobacteraeota bacterium]MCW5872376.1 hypothetical protein [Candidatus Eremiobacteraeota bacterium]